MVIYLSAESLKVEHLPIYLHANKKKNFLLLKKLSTNKNQNDWFNGSCGRKKPTKVEKVVTNLYLVKWSFVSLASSWTEAMGTFGPDHLDLLPLAEVPIFF